MVGSRKTFLGSWSVFPTFPGAPGGAQRALSTYNLSGLRPSIAKLCRSLRVRTEEHVLRSVGVVCLEAQGPVAGTSRQDATPWSTRFCVRGVNGAFSGLIAAVKGALAAGGPAAPLNSLGRMRARLLGGRDWPGRRAGDPIPPRPRDDHGVVPRRS